MSVNRTSLNVSLTPELEQFIIERVSSGRYQTASEVVRAGLRLLEQTEASHAQAAAKPPLSKGEHGGRATAIPAQPAPVRLQR